MRNLKFTILTVVPFEPLGASALPLDAVSVSATVGDFALVEAQVALSALPARQAHAPPLLVVALARAQHRALH